MMSPTTTASASRYREPTLEELLDEPIVQLVMKRDGVAPESMRKQLEQLYAQMLVSQRLS